MAIIPCKKPGLRSKFHNAAIVSQGWSWLLLHCSRRNLQPTDADIDAEVTNICRCGTYARIRKAIHAAAKSA